MTESWNVKKQMSRIKRSLSLNGLSTIGERSYKIHPLILALRHICVCTFVFSS